MSVRAAHRWLGLVFAAVVAAIFAALGLGLEVPAWAFYAPLPPLALQLASGLWLFARPGT